MSCAPGPVPVIRQQKIDKPWARQPPEATNRDAWKKEIVASHPPATWRSTDRQVQ